MLRDPGIERGGILRSLCFGHNLNLTGLWIELAARNAQSGRKESLHHLGEV
jgi:hypothetical protein